MHERRRKAAKLGIKRAIHVEVALTQPNIHGQNRWKTVTAKSKFKEVTRQNPRKSMRIKADGT